MGIEATRARTMSMRATGIAVAVLAATGVAANAVTAGGGRAAAPGEQGGDDAASVLVDAKLQTDCEARSPLVVHVRAFESKTVIRAALLRAGPSTHWVLFAAL